MQRKCCVHCPGDVTRTGEPAREHACSVPGYVAGSLRLTSLAGAGGAGAAKTERPAPGKLESQGSCYERFATARKFHAENLQHQPLPDKVDDAIFTAQKDSEDACMCDTVKRCQKIVPRRPANRRRELSRVHRYAPALGCKKPTTYMDLAICWETPVDAAYEPRRPVHIDGSDGGPAPAVFSLVQHEAPQVDVRDGCIPGRPGQPGQRGQPQCCESQRCDKCAQVRGRPPEADFPHEPDGPATLQRLGETDAAAKEELCRHLGAISLAGAKKPRPAVGAAARKRRADFLKHCATNVGHEAPRKPARSASCLQKRGCAVVERKCNGMPARTQVPRPRTPYARRSFCIDTLAPPFSIVSGCRDADYPEHWRLTSIYQQSYRNPRKMREGRTLLNYDRPFV